MKSRIVFIIVISFMSLFFALALGELEQPSEFFKILIEISKTLGATGLSVVILNLWIETKDWVQYINERLKSILVEQDYMNGMDRNTLDNIMFNLMKARFHGTTIEKEGGFFRSL